MTNVNPLSPIQKAWLAGFIDGEGFIGITFQRKKENSQQSATPRYHPYLIVTNNDKSSILHVKSLIGEGKIYQVRAKNSRFPYPAYQYKLTKMGDLNELLIEIRPYFIIKRKQCDLLLEYCNLRKERKIVSGYGSRGKTSFSAEEEAVYQRLLKLNKRGERKKDGDTLF